MCGRRRARLVWSVRVCDQSLLVFVSSLLHAGTQTGGVCFIYLPFVTSTCVHTVYATYMYFNMRAYSVCYVHVLQHACIQCMLRTCTSTCVHTVYAMYMCEVSIMYIVYIEAI